MSWEGSEKKNRAHWEARGHKSEHRRGSYRPTTAKYVARRMDLEIRSRSENIRMYGVPEGADSTRVTAFVERLLHNGLSSTKILLRSALDKPNAQQGLNYEKLPALLHQLSFLALRWEKWSSVKHGRARDLKGDSNQNRPWLPSPHSPKEERIKCWKRTKSLSRCSFQPG